ncbi:MAG TPA: hypothetical protein VEC19_12595 [Usitatibacter sp.]|nr:hypothetical protein [Usitatibacter sp.]
MQRNEMNPRRDAERDAAQPIAGQPRTDDEQEELQDPATVPSKLTAREFQLGKPGKASQGSDDGERHASASFTGAKGEPVIDDDEPPRGERGLPETRGDRMLKKDR